MSVLIVGSIAIDTVKTPVEEHSDLLGGSASLCRTRGKFLFAGSSGRHRRRRLSKIGIRFLEITQD